MDWTVFETDENWGDLGCVWCDKDGGLTEDDRWVVLPRVIEEGRLKVGGTWCWHCAEINHPVAEYEEYVRDQEILAEWLG